MAQTQFRGTTQLMDGTVPVSKLVSGFQIPTANLTDGATFVRSGGSVAFTANQSLGGFLITNSGDAVNPQDLVNLRTVQALVNGIAIKSARVVSVANQTLSGLPTVDGVTLTSGQLILLTAQSTGAQNGLWAVAAGAWTRPTSWAAASTQKSTLFFIEEGTTYHDTKWMAITDAITVDTTAVTISQDSSGTSYTNGNGLSLTGNIFAVKVGQGVEFDGSNNVQVKLDGSTIARSASGIKLPDGSTGGQVMVTNGSNIPTLQTVTGDVTISSGGVTTVNNTAGSGFMKYTNQTYNETPTGTINGVNTSFTLAVAPVNSSLRLYLNGMLLEPGAGNDYTISSNTITMLFAPATGDKLRAYYAK